MVSVAVCHGENRYLTNGAKNPEWTAGHLYCRVRKRGTKYKGTSCNVYGKRRNENKPAVSRKIECPIMRAWQNKCRNRCSNGAAANKPRADNKIKRSRFIVGGGAIGQSDPSWRGSAAISSYILCQAILVPLNRAIDCCTSACSQ